MNPTQSHMDQMRLLSRHTTALPLCGVGVRKELRRTAGAVKAGGDVLNGVDKLLNEFTGPFPLIIPAGFPGSPFNQPNSGSGYKPI